MIVQPTPTAPRVPARRGWMLGRLVAPVVLLAVVVVVGIFGPRQEPIPQAPQNRFAVNPRMSGEPVPMPVLVPPAMFGDLEALGPAEVQEIEGSASPATAFALVGYLRLDAADSACGDAGGEPFGAWCDRRGIIARTSWVGTGTGPFPPHVSVHVPVGVRVPSVLESAAPDDEFDPMPVLVVGRIAVRPAACQGYGPAVCEDEFVVDRVAWAGGVRMGLTPLIDDRLQGDRRPNPFMTSLDLADLPLLAALVWPEDVWRLDPDAGGVAIRGTSGEPVWYLRVLDGARTPSMERQVRWMLLAEPDLRVLASGRPGSDAVTVAVERG